MAQVIKPPFKINFEDKRFKLFCAGSIDNGNSEEFCEKIEKKLENYDIIIYNPRRDNWDKTTKQSSSNPELRAQIEWELYALNNSNLITMYFQPGTLSPVSMLELGLHANTGKMIVCCPEGFWRKANVDIVCEQHNIILTDTFDIFLNKIEKKITDAI